jgi:hypothetical protein
MNKVLIEITLNGRKHTYVRRLDMFGEVLTTTNKNSAHSFKKKDVPAVVKSLIAKFGKDNVKDLNILEEEMQ